jgi:ribosome-binding protein aMBF1 (putative translation factor)
MPPNDSAVGRFVRSDRPPGLADTNAGDIVASDRTSGTIESLLGHNLKAARLRAGLSQQDLAARAGVALALLAQIESGVSDPDLQVIGVLAKAVGRAAFELLKA